MSCTFVNEDLLGIYAVNDSLTGPPVFTWDHSSYQIEVTRAMCSPNNLRCVNYANKNYNGNYFLVNFQIANNVISVIDQDVDGNNIRSTSGYFSNDSIYFDSEYANEFGEVFYGKCYGKKMY